MSIGRGLVVLAWLLAIGAAAAIGWAYRPTPGGGITDQRTVIAAGRDIYAAQCALCHGSRLEGQPDWRQRRPDGKPPAPPHDASGQTWRHPDQVLFGITRDGLVPPWAPPGYPSEMPAFGGRLSDEEIWAVLSFIASSWPEDAAARQRRIDARARG